MHIEKDIQVLEGDLKVISQYEAIAKAKWKHTGQIDADGVLRDLDTGEKKRFISHPNSYNIIESIGEEPFKFAATEFL